jgi:DNA gyrase/topoisomerase IV subunit A
MQNLREVPVTIEEEMKDSYIDYAMSVIVSLPNPMCGMVSNPVTGASLLQ